MRYRLFAAAGVIVAIAAGLCAVLLSRSAVQADGPQRDLPLRDARSAPGPAHVSSPVRGRANEGIDVRRDERPSGDRVPQTHSKGVGRQRGGDVDLRAIAQMIGGSVDD